MYDRNFVICDREQQYAENLLQRFKRNKDVNFQLYLFHSPEELKRFTEKKKIHLLLIGEEYSRKQRALIPAQMKFVLVKSAQSVLEKGETGINRYQSAERIWTQIFEMVLKQKGSSPHSMFRSKGELIGIYSPIHRIGKTRFAFELGRKLAEKEPVLYLNLEEYAGGNYYFHEQPGYHLGDLLYFVKQNKGNLGIRISMMVGQDEKLDYILPMPCIQDIRAVQVEEWLELFDEILEQCIYEKVILDLGDSVDGLFQILERCATVYTPYLEDEAAKAKMNQYTENLRRLGLDSVLEKTVQKKVKPDAGGTVI